MSTEKKAKKSGFSVKVIVLTGMLSAAAGALMSLEFSLPIFPVFYKIDFSDVPSVIATLLMGPGSGACVEVIKILIKLITVGTSTNYVGELANLIGVVLFVVPIWLIFKAGHYTRKAAVTALSASIPIRIAVSCVVNACITLPLYSKSMGMDLNVLIQGVTAYAPAIKNLTTFIVLATVPFNLLKNILNNLIGYLIYDRIRHISFVPDLAREKRREEAEAKKAE